MESSCSGVAADLSSPKKPSEAVTPENWAMVAGVGNCHLELWHLATQVSVAGEVIAGCPHPRTRAQHCSPYERGKRCPALATRSFAEG